MLKWYTLQEQIPHDKEVIKVEFNNKQDMVTLRGGIAYKWRYKETDEVFCKLEEIYRWRYCRGMDF